MTNRVFLHIFTVQIWTEESNGFMHVNEAKSWWGKTCCLTAETIIGGWKWLCMALPTGSLFVVLDILCWGCRSKRTNIDLLVVLLVSVRCKSGYRRPIWLCMRFLFNNLMCFLFTYNRFANNQPDLLYVLKTLEETCGSEWFALLRSAACLVGRWHATILAVVMVRNGVQTFRLGAVNEETIALRCLVTA